MRYSVIVVAALAMACGKKDDTKAADKCVEPSTLSCQRHSDCAQSRSCAEKSSLCDTGSRTCTADIVAYEETSPPTAVAPQLACLATPPVKDPVSNPSQNVRVRGCIDSFGLEAKTIAGPLKVAFYRQSDVLAQGQLATPILTVDSMAEGTVYADLPGTDCEYDGAYDTATALGGTTTLPTETALAVSVTADPTLWVNTWRFGIYLKNAEVPVNKQTVNAITRSTYNLIPSLGGLAKIQPDRGAIAGGVSDCADSDIGNVVVSFTGFTVRKTLYFDGQEDPNPASAKAATNIDGLFAGVDAVPGKGTITASGKKDGATIQWPTYDLMIFADSVTIVNPTSPMPQ